jgi:cobalamin biosynthesis Mg chelatase CobN
MEEVSRQQHQLSRMDDLERLLRSQQKEWQTTNDIANTTAQQLTEIQSRMAEMDKLQENVTLTMEGQARLTITVTGLTEQIQRLTQVIDRMSQTPPVGSSTHTLPQSHSLTAASFPNTDVHRQLLSSSQTVDSMSTGQSQSSEASPAASSDLNQSCYQSPQKKKLKVKERKQIIYNSGGPCYKLRHRKHASG